MTALPPAGQLGTLLSEGREAQVYARDADTVVKLYRPGFGGHASESLALTALHGNPVAPRLIDTVDCDGRVGLVLQRLAGVDMLALLQHQPWRIFSLARTMAATQLAVHKCSGATAASRPSRRSGCPHPRRRPYPIARSVRVQGVGRLAGR